MSAGVKRTASAACEEPHATTEAKKFMWASGHLLAAMKRRADIMKAPAPVSPRWVIVFPELTKAMQEEVSKALEIGNPDEELARAFKLVVTRRDMATLKEGQWLNDTVVNVYLGMIVKRPKKRGALLVYAFNTFFFGTLESRGYEAVQAWTKNVNIFTYDILLVPLHFKNHWCLAVVDFRTLRFTTFDSLSPSRVETKHFKILGTFLQKEAIKHGYVSNWASWKTFRRSDIPLQENHSDCGVFMCQYADCVSRDVQCWFKQKDMPYFRQRVVYEILKGRLLEG